MPEDPAVRIYGMRVCPLAITARSTLFAADDAFAFPSALHAASHRVRGPYYLGVGSISGSLSLSLVR